MVDRLRCGPGRQLGFARAKRQISSFFAGKIININIFIGISVIIIMIMISVMYMYIIISDVIVVTVINTRHCFHL
jgi:hypothetical protein